MRLSFRVYLWAGLFALLSLAVVYMAHLRRENAKLKDAGKTAVVQAQVNDQAGKITERVIRSEIEIHHKTEGAVDAVQQAEGADAPLSPDLRSSVLDGIERLRDDQGRDDPGSRSPEGAVPKS